MTIIVQLAIISALTSLFLDFCFREGNIFAWWLDFWADVFIDDKIKYPKGVDKRDYKFSQVENGLFKPLGYCVVCSNVWISILIGFAGCFTWNIHFTSIFLIIILSSLK